MNRGEFGRTARKRLATMLLHRMKEQGVTVEQLAERANVTVVVAQRLLSCIPNPERPEISRIISVPGLLNKQERRMGYTFMDAFSPSNRRKRRFHID